MYRCFFFLLALTVQQSFAFRLRAESCEISIPNLDPAPIVIKSNDSTFLYPTPNADSIILNAGEEILISCTGGTLTAGSTKGETVTATCVSGTKFTINDQSVQFNSIKCSRIPFHTARYTNKSCETNGKEVEIGFELTPTNFLRQIRICFDDVLQTTLYSQYDLTASIGSHESGVSRPSFIEDNFYEVGSQSVNDLYVRGGQRTTINGLLGLSSGSTKYIQDNNDFFLSRGHLSAKADFVYAVQQRATFHYINVAPQWQTVNGKSWNNVETQVRDYGESNTLNLVVTTGTYGVATLPHAETGDEVELYLYVDGDQKGIPVPELYWKLVYNPESKQGVAILGLNNPYQEDVSKSIICNDVSDQITWVEWTTNIEDGYLYACSVDELKEKIPYIPDVEISGLLL